VKVLLISTTREHLPDPVFPLGLAYVAAALEGAGHEVGAIDLCFVADPDIEVEVARAVADVEPDVVGLSLRNIDSTTYPRTTCYHGLYQRVMRACRRSSGSFVVLGGAGFTIVPDEFMALLDADYGVVGEGEEAMPKLLAHIAGGARGPLPRGVVTRGSPRTVPRHLPDWGTRRPARRLFSAADYAEKGGMLNIQTRRGCPFGCIHCTYPRLEGSRFRLRPAVDVADELEHVIEETGVRHFFFVDAVFNHPREHALDLCGELARRGLGASWTCYANPGRLDRELAGQMLKAGCEGVELGTDALVDEVLASLGKGFTFADVQESTRSCLDVGLPFSHSIFLGAPDEDLDRARLAIDRLASLDADSSLVTIGIRVLPGTALADRAQRELGIERVGLDPVFYVSPALAPHLERLVEDLVAEHPSWVVPGLGRNYDERIQEVLRRSGKRGVVWTVLSRR
jgi:radical SAM superfamily enzyme YgiQ (UPF0313 family)